MNAAVERVQPRNRWMKHAREFHRYGTASSFILIFVCSHHYFGLVSEYNTTPEFLPGTEYKNSGPKETVSKKQFSYTNGGNLTFYMVKYPDHQGINALGCIASYRRTLCESFANDTLIIWKRIAVVKHNRARRYTLGANNVVVPNVSQLPFTLSTTVVVLRAPLQTEFAQTTCVTYSRRI